MRVDLKVYVRTYNEVVMQTATKKPTNLLLDQVLLQKAKL